MNPPEAARAQRTKKRTRIQQANEEKILDAALDVFSTYGFRGATIDQIAERAGMTKPNLLYYFRRKEDIYRAILEHTLDDWLGPLTHLGEGEEPLAELKAYIDRKLELSRDRPKASRLFALEILQGAPVIGDVLAGPLKALVDEKAEVIRRWIAEGRIAPVDPHHLVFTIWATTQHYADFDVQVRAVLGAEPSDTAHFDRAARTLEELILGGLRPRPG